MAVLAVALLALAPACRKEKTPADDDEQALAEDGTDASSAEIDQGVLGSTLVSATSGGTLTLASSSDLALSTSDVGDGAKAFFFPRGCLVTAHDAATRTVTYDFNDCSGPSGLLRIKGQVKATYEVQPNQLTLDLVGTGLRINRATADWHARATVSADGVSRTMTWKAELAGTTARGREFSRTNEKVLKWSLGDRCFALSGTSQGTVRGREIRTEIADFARCAGSCPEAGGRITITNVTASKTVELRFDGSAVATFTNASGEQKQIPLACGR